MLSFKTTRSAHAALCALVIVLLSGCIKDRASSDASLLNPEAAKNGGFSTAYERADKYWEYFHMAEGLRQQEKYQLAIDTYKMAVGMADLRSERAAPNEGAAKCYVEMGNYQDAIRHYRLANESTQNPARKAEFEKKIQDLETGRRPQGYVSQ